MLLQQVILASRQEDLRNFGRPSRQPLELLQETLTQHWQLVGEPSLQPATITSTSALAFSRTMLQTALTSATLRQASHDVNMFFDAEILAGMSSGLTGCAGRGAGGAISINSDPVIDPSPGVCTAGVVDIKHTTFSGNRANSGGAMVMAGAGHQAICFQSTSSPQLGFGRCSRLLHAWAS